MNSERLNPPDKVQARITKDVSTYIFKAEALEYLSSDRVKEVENEHGRVAHVMGSIL